MRLPRSRDRDLDPNYERPYRVPSPGTEYGRLLQLGSDSFAVGVRVLLNRGQSPFEKDSDPDSLPLLLVAGMPVPLPSTRYPLLEVAVKNLQPWPSGHTKERPPLSRCPLGPAETLLAGHWLGC